MEVAGDVEGLGAVGEGGPEEDHAFVVIGLNDHGLAIEGEVGIGVIGAVEVEADDVVVVVEVRGLVGGYGGTIVGVGDGVSVERIGVEAVDEESGDGGETDEPPGPALARDDEGDDGEAEEDGKGGEGPLVLAGEEDQGEAMGELGKGGVGAVGDDGGGESGEQEQDEGEEHN